jgi:hypothetical protein
MSFRRFTVLVALRALEAMVGQAIFHIMPWSSVFMVYIKIEATNEFLFDSWKH